MAKYLIEIDLHNNVYKKWPKIWNSIMYAGFCSAMERIGLIIDKNKKELDIDDSDLKKNYECDCCSIMAWNSDILDAEIIFHPLPAKEHAVIGDPRGELVNDKVIKFKGGKDAAQERKVEKGN